MRSQTSTEYLIISAVVIIITVLVIAVCGGIPGIGAGKGEVVSEVTLKFECTGVNNIDFFHAVNLIFAKII